MSYTISQAAQMTGISPSAIRYYDKEGLLPQVERKNGIRLFSNMDIRWLHLLTVSVIFHGTPTVAMV